MSSAAIFAPRTIDWPAAGSPGGESGVSTPIFTGFWARAGGASTARVKKASTMAVRRLLMLCILRRSEWVWKDRRAASYASGPGRVKLRVPRSAAAEPLQQGRVGGRKPVTAELGGTDPEDLLAFERPRLAPALAAAEREADPPLPRRPVPPLPPPAPPRSPASTAPVTYPAAADAR